MKKLFKYTIPTLLLLLVFCGFTRSMESEAADIYIEFITWKYDDNSRSLIAKISSDNETGEYFVEGLPVQFLLFDGEDFVEIGEAMSNIEGTAELNLPDGSIHYPKDEEGYITFASRFRGNEKYLEAEEELMIKDVVIDIRFEENDEEKLIFFEGLIKNAESDDPLADDDLYFYVPRMFSDMKIADGWFEEDGTGYIEFPTRIIGDSLGNVQVIARIEDHYDYGNVEVSGIINWATPKRLIAAEGPVRELWTPIAPLWMIITLIIMLAGVWGHYIYAIIQLIKIKKAK